MRYSHKGSGDADARIQIFRQGFSMGSACRFIGKIKKGHKAPEFLFFQQTWIYFERLEHHAISINKLDEFILFL